MEWKQLLASITGSVDEELRLCNAYAENRLLRHQIKKRRVLLSDAERQMLAEMGHTLGRQALAEIATIGSCTWALRIIDRDLGRAVCAACISRRQVLHGGFRSSFSSP
jgi:hypothetical protein